MSVALLLILAAPAPRSSTTRDALVGVWLCRWDGLEGKLTLNRDSSFFFTYVNYESQPCWIPGVWTYESGILKTEQDGIWCSVTGLRWFDHRNVHRFRHKGGMKWLGEAGEWLWLWRAKR